jgi:DNA-binding XRE family transcriptional regulator
MLRISEFIKDRGMTQAQFAKEIGISEAMLSLCLRRKRRPGLSVAIKIKKVTGLTLDEIYRGIK